jgi:3'-phosphoadenosine 5'-phosphosulfate sulfotransferase (PAPS reductase)/FAD synthetase
VGVLTVSKPEPESDPVDIFEQDLLDTSGCTISDGIDRFALFSGGDDSLALTHLAMEQGWTQGVVHLVTRSAIPENIDYVRRVCRDYAWPLFLIRAPIGLDTFGFRYGFPGADLHQAAFNYFKGRQLQALSTHRDGDLKLFSGVRIHESDRRMENISAEVEYQDPQHGNFRGWWISPLFEERDQWVLDYRKQHDLPRNPVAQKIHRSGDCQCLAFGHRDEELVQIMAEYEDFGQWLMNVETRVQEYRGRVDYLQDQYPSIYNAVDDRRDDSRPKPFRLSILRDRYPGIFADVVSLSADDAITRGKLDTNNYLGHGGLSSKELREKLADADASQRTLCDTCAEPDTSLPASVRRRRSEAVSDVGEGTHQIELDASF